MKGHETRSRAYAWLATAAAAALSGCSGSAPGGATGAGLGLQDARAASVHAPAPAVARSAASRAGSGTHLDSASIMGGTNGSTLEADGTHRYQLRDGSTLILGTDGFGVHADAAGRKLGMLWMPLAAGRAVLTGSNWPSTAAVERRVAQLGRGLTGKSLIVVFANAQANVGPSAGASALTTSPLVSDPALDRVLREAGAQSITPLLPPGHLAALAGVGSQTGQLDLSRAYIVGLGGSDPLAAARRLRLAAGVRYAVPNWIVSPMSTEPHRIPASALRAATHAAPAADAGLHTAALPGNAGIAQSIQSYLNANGVDALGAYAEIRTRFGQLPGAGTVITNVSLGDLTDQSMADAGDPYVRIYGPTTIVQGGQRYLDFPSLPLIPTYTVDMSGALNPLGSVEGVDPNLGEVLLDFSVMAPLPHDRQRPGEQGQGYLDLLGIAPGASYRLVVPQDPTIANILVAMISAAHQSPRPDIVTASVGYGFDGYGFPGRYLEDDPLSLAVVQAIVQSGTVVTISANDGLRLFTNAAVGPDGGAAPTDLALTEFATSVADDSTSSIPSLVPDSGAIAVGGSTLDDIFAAPPQWHTPLAAEPAFPETRFDGGTYYASGFGTRVNVSAPSDNIAVLAHQCLSNPCAPQDAVAVLEGGTSASAPMTAAAAAVLLQVARLTGAALTPEQLRSLLIDTGRLLPNPPQADRPISVGRQIDLTAAVELLLARRGVAPAAPAIVRIGVAQRQNIGDLGASFTEGTDRTAIDLTGPLDFNGNPSGQNSVSPITLAADVVGVAARTGVRYRWTIGQRVIESHDARALRLLPADILADAGQPLVSTDQRVVPVKLEVLRDADTLASAATTLTFSASKGTYEESLAPHVPPVAVAGEPVRVRYDLRHVTGLNSPQLVLSSIGHWNPATGEVFRTAWSAPLAGTSGEVMIPASAFAGGAGLYGVGILLDSSNLIWGEFAPLHVAAAQRRELRGDDALLSDQRPPAPELSPADGSASFGHAGAVTRAAPRFQVRWDASRVDEADGALLEISSPGPTIRFLYSTFQNPNGDRPDANGGDTPSRRHVSLHGTSGTMTFDALQLGLPTSMFYTVRVLATSGGHAIGQASPVSSLVIDDGLPPGGGEVIDFDVPPAGPAAVTVAQVAPTTLPGQLGATIYWYLPRDGAYGAVLTGDVTGATDLHVVGSDPTLGSTLVVGLSNVANDEYLWVFGADGKVRSTTHLDVTTDPYLMGARVDAVRHRAAILGWASSDYSDLILPFDLTSGTLGTAINADVGAPAKPLFRGLDLDATTGRVFPASLIWGDLCFVLRGGSYVSAVDLDTGSAATVAQDSHCTTGIAADQLGGALHTTIGPVYSFPMFPPGQTQQIDETSLTATAPRWLGGRGALYPVVDPVNHLLLAQFMAGEDYFFDNSATSVVGVFDLTSGKRVALLRDFNFVAILGSHNYFELAARGLQLDPHARTGWTYGPLDAQIQEFSY